jgi:hypothetical protein
MRRFRQERRDKMQKEECVLRHDLDIKQSVYAIVLSV